MEMSKLSKRAKARTRKIWSNRVVSVDSAKGRDGEEKKTRCRKN